ncbi:MAG: FIST C-terminal domain-containing protein [Gemmatimonadaceae bacterium]|jgi:hypothetical protein|nr:FIST C-terminal domain-containing protein [Gemmatimonadaceae bacterium]
MHADQYTWLPTGGWSPALPPAAAPSVQLVLAYGPVDAPPPEWFDALRAVWPAARLVYVSGGGQIAGATVQDDATVVCAITFRRTRVTAVATDGSGPDDAEALGRRIGEAFSYVDALRHVLVFTEGLSLNGSAFVRGLHGALPSHVGVSGGLASDGVSFARSCVGLDGPPAPDRIVAVGLSGDALVVGTGSEGGWQVFGPDRLVTRASGVLVHELDGERALDVYRRYLGPFADELPGSALLFPLALGHTVGEAPIVRTILGIDEATGALRFAGEVPEGRHVRLMRSDADQLLDGAAEAAVRARRSHDGAVPPVVALCFSCIGRRAVLRSRTEEELEEVQQVLGDAVLAGFYSNGEIGPHGHDDVDYPILHNQTMTITTLAER